MAAFLYSEKYTVDGMPRSRMFEAVKMPKSMMLTSQIVSTTWLWV